MNQSNSNIKTLSNCLACGSNNLGDCLDLGDQPLANSYLKGPNDPELKFPLALNVCKDCWHCQLSHAVNPDLMFKHYLYVSGTSQTLKDYFKWFAQFAVETFKSHNSLINVDNFLDIACNDGTQLDILKELFPRNITTYGIDPAQNLYEKTKNGHIVVCDYLNHDSTNQLLSMAKNYGEYKFDIVNAQNVFAHNADPVDFLKCCANLLSYNGFLFIQNSQADMIKNGEFDTMYHEHVSFWNLSSMMAAAKRAELTVVDHIRVPVHGISDMFILSKKYAPSFKIKNELEMERISGGHSIDRYSTFGYKADYKIRKFQEKLDNYRSKYPDGLFVGFGAAAKGNTFLNAGNIKLDYVIDENPLKQGLYTPGTHIPIVGTELLKTNNKLIVVPLAWNFKEEIFRKIKDARPGRIDHYITYFPHVDDGIL
jgi:SAM-dependent methyltransferase